MIKPILFILDSFYFRLVVKGYRKVLQNKDLWSLNSYLTSSHIVTDFNRYWTQEMEKYKL